MDQHDVSMDTSEDVVQKALSYGEQTNDLSQVMYVSSSNSISLYVSHCVQFTDPERKPAFSCQVLQGPSQTEEFIVDDFV